MIYWVDNRSVDDPHVNLALEEFCLRNLPSGRSYVLFYVNRPAVVVGRHQNILQEVNLRYAQEARVPIVRRISGGGSVYHDHGNLNFCFINAYHRHSLVNVRQTIAPIQAALTALGVPAVFNQKNDLLIAGRKISGNAQFSDTKQILVHGTLLYSSNLDRLTQALDVHADHIVSKARKSIPSAVANISSHLKCAGGLPDFRRRLRLAVADHFGGIQPVALEKKAWQAIDRLAAEKYRSWDWNYAKAPTFRIDRNPQGADDRFGYTIDIANGRIVSVRFNSNGLKCVDLQAIASRLTGVAFRRDAVGDCLTQLEPQAFGRHLDPHEMAAFLTADLGITPTPVLQIPQGDLC